MNLHQEILNTAAIVMRLPDIVDTALIGSALYCEDAKDVDIAVLLAPGVALVEYQNMLCRDQWTPCGEYDQSSGIWTSVRKGYTNLMITESRDFFEGYKRAMQVCKYLNVKSKEVRIAICQIVRDGKDATEVKTK